MLSLILNNSKMRKNSHIPRVFCPQVIMSVSAETSPRGDLSSALVERQKQLEQREKDLEMARAATLNLIEPNLNAMSTILVLINPNAWRCPSRNAITARGLHELHKESETRQMTDNTVYRHTVTVSSGFVSSVLLTN